MSFNYSFREMVKWYDEEKDNEQWFSNDQNVTAFFISRMKKYEQLSDKQIKKKGLAKASKNISYVNKFIKQNVNVNNIRRLKFIDNDKYISHGIYYVKQDDDNVFFMYPTLHTDRFTNATIICGDHFSFPLNKKDVHIHVTQYVHVPDNLNIGQVYHLPRVILGDSVRLPLTGYGTSVLSGMGHYQNEILDICRAYTWTSDHSMDQSAGAGGLKKSVNVILPIKKPKVQVKVKDKDKTKAKRVVTRQNVSVQLDKLLAKYKVKRVNAFGYRHENKWHMMVDLVRPDSSKLENEFAFVMKGQGKLPQFSTFQNKLYKALKETPSRSS